MKLRFLGGAQTVTGSKTWVQAAGRSYLVDCGLFQGLKELRLRNWATLPLNARELDAVFLTHAHLDHSGWLPLLVRQGFRGRVYCTRPTRELAEIVLTDSARLQLEDADFANRKGFSKHHPAQPLYTVDDVRAAMERFRPVRPGEWFDLPGDAAVRFTPNGHILGSACVELRSEGRTALFSGDLGRPESLLLEAPPPPPPADLVVVESTYGDRTHHPEDTRGRLLRILRETAGRGGHLIVPSFAVGRAQELLHLLAQLSDELRSLGMPVYLDSPMAQAATGIFEDHPGWHRLSPAEVAAMWKIVTPVRDQAHSIQVMRSAGPAVVIAGSGMISGGRVLHHLAYRLPDPRNTVLLTGYQAAGTRGRLLREGIAELKMHGRYVPVKARVEELTGLSAHADQSELLAWLAKMPAPAPRRVFVNHGEPQAVDALRVKIRDTLGWNAEPAVPDLECVLD